MLYSSDCSLANHIYELLIFFFFYCPTTKTTAATVLGFERQTELQTFNRFKNLVSRARARTRIHTPLKPERKMYMWSEFKAGHRRTFQCILIHTYSHTLAKYTASASAWSDAHSFYLSLSLLISIPISLAFVHTNIHINTRHILNIQRTREQTNKTKKKITIYTRRNTHGIKSHFISVITMIFSECALLAYSLNGKILNGKALTATLIFIHGSSNS